MRAASSVFCKSLIFTFFFVFLSVIVVSSGKNTIPGFYGRSATFFSGLVWPARGPPEATPTDVLRALSFWMCAILNVYEKLRFFKT